MKLELMSGQPDVSLTDKFTELLKKNGYYAGDIEQKNFMIFPELQLKHQKKTYDEVRRRVKRHIESDDDLFILTYSDHVLNAMRVEIAMHKFKGAKVHQLLQNGEDCIANINTDGRLTCWADNIFDVWDKALDELLFNI